VSAPAAAGLDRSGRHDRCSPALPMNRIIALLLLSACAVEDPTERRSAALRLDDGSPSEPPDDPPGPGTGDGWTVIDTRCYASGCVYEYLRPPGSCTNATVFGPACGAALAQWNADNPGVPGRCAGAVMGCTAPGERTPCTSPCEMNLFIEIEGYGCSATNPCAEGFVCESGSCLPDCGPEGCGPGDCDPTTGICAPCTGDDSCEDDARCIGGRCVESCDPASPGTCSRGTCDPATQECRECRADECGEGRVCDPNNGRCREVRECPDGACAYGRCVDGTCRACTRTSGCEDGEVCNTDNGTCTDGCSGPSDCIFPGQECIDGVCRKACGDDAECDRTSYCEGGYCRNAYPSDGRCPRPDMTVSGAWCYASCASRTNACGPLEACDPVNGDCRIACGPGGLDCPMFQQCLSGLCIDKCDPRVLPCPPGTCTYDDAQNPYCASSCSPADRCCGVTCTGGSTCDPETGFCSGGFDPCAGVFCPSGTCVGGICTSSGGCTWDFDCSSGDVCEDGVCVDPGGVEVCAMDGACTAGETCGCDPFCCGGGGGGSGPGGGCGWDGGPTISYGDCAACGGSVTWTGDHFACVDMQMQ
jgi:hypothetical protein